MLMLQRDVIKIQVFDWAIEPKTQGKLFDLSFHSFGFSPKS